MSKEKIFMIISIILIIIFVPIICFLISIQPDDSDIIKVDTFIIPQEFHEEMLILSESDLEKMLCYNGEYNEENKTYTITKWREPYTADYKAHNITNYQCLWYSDGAIHTHSIDYMNERLLCFVSNADLELNKIFDTWGIYCGEYKVFQNRTQLKTIII